MRNWAITAQILLCSWLNYRYNFKSILMHATTRKRIGRTEKLFSSVSVIMDIRRIIHILRIIALKPHVQSQLYIFSKAKFLIINFQIYLLFVLKAIFLYFDHTFLKLNKIKNNPFHTCSEHCHLCMKGYKKLRLHDINYNPVSRSLKYILFIFEVFVIITLKYFFVNLL